LLDRQRHTSNVVGGGGEVDLATIAQTVSAIGTLLLAALFGYQVTVFNKQVAVNRGTLNEMREGRTAHERPQVVVTAEYRHGTLVEVVIANIGFEDQPFGVHQQVALATPYLLVSVVAPLFSTHACGLRGLGVGDPCAGERVPAQAGPQPLAQRGVEPLEGRVYAPPPEPSIDGLPRREIAGQEPPGTTALQDVEDGVEDLAGAVGFRSSSLVGSRNIRLQTYPFGVG
jgi:hypothetical protein